jgi:cytochrome b
MFAVMASKARLAALIVMHIVAAVVTDVREGDSITSAMFTGRKTLSRPLPAAP